MPLTFKVAELIAVAQATIDKKHAAEITYREDKAVARQVYRRQWWRDNKSRVREVRDLLTASIRIDAPPETSDISRIMGSEEGRGYVSFFNGGGDGNVKAPAGFNTRVDELEGLVALLTAHQTETVTLHQLKELGYNPHTMARLFRDAVAAGAHMPEKSK